MADSAITKNDAGAAKELLMADYAYLRDSFWKNEEAGERRVQFFATLVTAVITALVAINGTSGIQDKDLRLLLSLFALFSLLVLGTVTLFRIIQRNRVSDGYKKDMDMIRERIKAQYDEQKVLAGYFPLKRTTEKRFSLRRFGGLSYTVAAINSVLLAALCAIALYLQKDADKTAGHLMLVMLGCFASSYTVQIGIILLMEWKSKARLSAPLHTHAGGVVVRFDAQGEQQYLLVRSTNDSSWVLPKGHIKEGESPVEAAVREVEEEAGIKATMIDSIGTSLYQTDDETIRVHFFLMIYERPSEQPGEKRKQEWLSYDETLQRLEFINAKDMLHRAKVMASAFTRI